MMMAKGMRRRRRAGFGATAAAGVVALASPAAAEVVLLDCDVTIQSTSNYRGEERSSSRHSGTWRFRLDTDGGRATLLEAPLVFRVPSSSETPFNLRGLSVALTATEDAYSFCIGQGGSLSCNERTTLAGGSWYSVDRAHIDRRRGTFRVLVESYSDLLQGRALHEYSGTCQRAPEQQF